MVKKLLKDGCIVKSAFMVKKRPGSKPGNRVVGLSNGKPGIRGEKNSHFPFMGSPRTGPPAC